jgi:hypothetical protein
MGAYMKFSGYDAIIFQGIARHWVYLYMHDGTADEHAPAHGLGENVVGGPNQVLAAPLSRPVGGEIDETGIELPELLVSFIPSVQGAAADIFNEDICLLTELFEDEPTLTGVDVHTGMELVLGTVRPAQATRHGDIFLRSNSLAEYAGSLGAGLLHDVDVLEISLRGIVRLHRRVGVDVADGPVVVRGDLEPVMDAA